MYKGINDFKKGYHPRTNIVKDEKGDMFADSHSILARYRYSFSQLLNIHGVNDVRQRHTGEPLVPGPSGYEFKLVIEKLKGHKSPGIFQIPAELIKAGGRTIRYEIIHLLLLIPNYNQQDTTFLNLFISTDALHVSGGYSAHHQEHITVHTPSGTVNQYCC